MSLNSAQIVEYLKAVNQLKMMNLEQRINVMSHFCRECSISIKELDYSGRNFCSRCSPDRKED